MKRCLCGATKFQGPFPVGTFVNGTFVPEEELFTCRNCHRTAPMSAIDDYETMAA